MSSVSRRGCSGTGLKSIQKFASVHVNAHHHFNSERHLIEVKTHKTCSHAVDQIIQSGMNSGAVDKLSNYEHMSSITLLRDLADSSDDAVVLRLYKTAYVHRTEHTELYMHK